MPAFKPAVPSTGCAMKVLPLSVGSAPTNPLMPLRMLSETFTNFAAFMIAVLCLENVMALLGGEWRGDKKGERRKMKFLQDRSMRNTLLGNRACVRSALIGQNAAQTCYLRRRMRLKFSRVTSARFW